VELLAGDDEIGGGLKVTRGVLTVRSKNADAPVKVSAGYSLRLRPRDNPRADESHPLLARLDVAEPRLKG